MLKMDITFEDFNGKQHVDSFYFNMTRREVFMLQAKHSRLIDAETGAMEGGFQEYIESVINRGNGEEIANLFEDLILQSYGVKSEDGMSFVKNEKLRDDFKNTAAYDQLFFEVITDEKAMKSFVENVFPKPEEEKNVAPPSAHGFKNIQENPDNKPAAPVQAQNVSTENPTPAQPAENVPTDEQIREYLAKQKNDENK